MVLVCSSHDAYDRMTFVPVVGASPNYPNEQYKLATWELIDRYLIPYIKTITSTKHYADPDAEVEKRAANKQVVKKSPNFVKGFDDLKQMADSLQIPFYVYLHAELGETQQQKFNEMGQQIIVWADSADVTLINGIEEGENEEMYHDAIHFNEKGQRHLADVLKKHVKQ